MLRIFLALWLAFTPALSWAGSRTLLGVGAPTAAAPSFSLAFQSSQSSTTNATTVNFGTVTFLNGQYAIASLGWLTNNPGPTTITSVTVNGVSFTQVPGAAVGTSSTFGGAVDMWISPTPMSGTSGTAAVVYSAAAGSFGAPSNIAIYSMNTAHPTVSAAQTSILANNNPWPLSGLAVPTGGGGITALYIGGGSGTFTSFTNAGTDAASGNAAFGTVAGTGTVVVSGNFTANAGGSIAAASWGP